jgi:hypothetical protein
MMVGGRIQRGTKDIKQGGGEYDGWFGGMIVWVWVWKGG